MAVLNSKQTRVIFRVNQHICVPVLSTVYISMPALLTIILRCVSLLMTIFSTHNPDVVNFVTSIKTKYKGRFINRKKQWLIRHSSKLVRLQLVSKNKVESSSTSTRRGEDDKSTPLAYCDLFKPESGKVEPVNKVLVEGGAGIGKTTLSVSLSEDWACGKLFQEFELLLLLPLCHRKVSSAGSLPELLKLFHTSPRVCESVASYLEDEQGENVLVIADGWDELRESQRSEDSFLYQLLFVDFPLMSVVVTSRPSASAPLHNLACVNRFVEIKGFGKDDIKEYIQSEFVTDQEKAQRLREQLEDNPLIESVCSIPLNCAIVCHLWHCHKEELPSTMTQLYEKIILHFVCHNLRKLPAFGPTFSMESFDDVPESLKKSWWKLCEFAFEALKDHQIVFSKKELPEISKDEQVLCFGLLQSVETVLALTCEVSYNFLHLTFMEYLAALHLSKQPLNSLFVLFFNPHFEMVLRFFFGIRFYSSNNGADIGCVKLAMQHVDRLTLCHCAFEAQNVIVHSEMQFDGELGIPNNPHDCAAILYVINNMKKCSGLEIIFNYNCVRDKQIRILADVLARKNGELQVKWLSLMDNKLTDDTVSYLFEHASDAFQYLTNIRLRDNKIGVESIKSLTTALAKSSSNGCTLSEFVLSSSNLDDEGLRVFVNNLEGECHVEDLYLDDNGIHATGFSCLADAVCSGKIVIKDSLLLSYNCLGLKGALAVGRMLSNNYCPVNHLNLSECELTTAGGSLPYTDPLNLDSSITSETVRQQLCQMSQNNTITFLDLDYNTFTGNDIHILAGFICLCSSLGVLSTCNCGITSDDLRQLFEILKSSFSGKPLSKLQYWDLGDNKIDDDGISTLEPLLSLFPRLYDIGLSNDVIVSEEMEEELRRREEVRCCV